MADKWQTETEATPRMDDMRRDRTQQELIQQIAELRASRARIAARSTAERSAVERALHDGVQQHLVALAVNVQLAQQLLDSDPAAARTLLDELGRSVHEALDGVRELAHRLYPPLLLDRGLAETLRAAAAVATLPMTVETTNLERYAAGIEAAAYFCCLTLLERLAAVGGGDARGVIRAWSDDGSLRFELEVEYGRKTPPNLDLTDARDAVEAWGGQLSAVLEREKARIAGSIPFVP